ncbi:hypothetical protein GCM10009565_27500 [Amycolatopsis albidoflavus]
MRNGAHPVPPPDWAAGLIARRTANRDRRFSGRNESRRAGRTRLAEDRKSLATASDSTALRPPLDPHRPRTRPRTVRLRTREGP